MIAAEIMDQAAPTLAPDDSIVRAAELLTAYEHSALAVVDADGRFLGAVGEEDLLALALPAGGAADIKQLSYLPRCYGLRDLSHEALQQVTVGKIMRTEGVVTVSEDDLAAQAALLIIRAHQPQIFVVRDGQYVGRLDRKQIIAEMVNPSLGLACHP